MATTKTTQPAQGGAWQARLKRPVEILTAVADPNRMEIVRHLLGGSRNVTEPARLLNVEIVNVSHHLGVLRQSGLARDEKMGRFVVYSLNEDLFSRPAGPSGPVVLRIDETVALTFSPVG